MVFPRAELKALVDSQGIDAVKQVLVANSFTQLVLSGLNVETADDISQAAIDRFVDFDINRLNAEGLSPEQINLMQEALGQVDSDLRSYLKNGSDIALDFGKSLGDKLLRALGPIGITLSFMIASEEASALEAAGNSEAAKERMELWAVESASSEAAGVASGTIAGIGAAALVAAGIISAPVAIVTVIGASLAGGYFGAEGGNAFYDWLKAGSPEKREQLIADLSRLFFGDEINLPEDIRDGNFNFSNLDYVIRSIRETPAEIVDNARSDQAWAYAIRELNSFVVEGANYAQHNTDGSLDLSNLSDEYLTSRAQMIVIKGLFDRLGFDYDDRLNTFLGLLPAPIDGDYIYTDMTSGLTLDVDGFNPLTLESHRITFGSQNGERIEGGSIEDELYGMSGDDVLVGQAGNDYLEGGEGNDTYIFNTGDGQDIIRDQQGLNQLVINGNTIRQLQAVIGNLGVYQAVDNSGNLLDENTLYIINGNRLIITVGGVNSGDFITVENFDLANNAFGINQEALEPEEPITDNAFVWNAENLEARYGANFLNNAGYFLAYERITKGGWDHSQSMVYDAINDPYLIEQDGRTLGRFEGSGINDNLVGGDNVFNDLSGLAGDDNITAGNIGGFYIGGQGSDVLTGGLGNDFIWGGDNWQNRQNFLNQSQSLFDFYNENLQETVGDSNRIVGGAGNDVISAGAFDDFVRGGEDNDIVFGETGSDILYGEAGNDTVLGDSRSAFSINVANGEVIRSAYFEFFNDIDNSVVASTDFDDVINGGAGNDSLYGERGNDFILAETGNDVIQGDRVYTYSSANLITNLSENATQAAFTLSGQFHGDDVIYAGVGNDTVLGNGGNDTIYAGADNDFVLGDDHVTDEQYHGNDILYGEGGDDTLIGGMGNDQLYGGADNDTLLGDGEVIEEQGGPNQSLFRFRDNPQFTEGGDDVIDGGSGNDTLFGGAGDDLLLGGSGNDALLGGRDNDYLNGGAGDDELQGNQGDDILNGGNGNDVYVYEQNAGLDRIEQAGDGTDTLFFNQITLDRLSFSQEGNDLLILVDGNADQGIRVVNHFLGGDAAIEQIQAQGANTLFIRDIERLVASDIAKGDFDQVFTGTATDDEQLVGNTGNDRVRGLAGKDILFGLQGDDLLEGGSDNDRLIGGDGSSTNSGADTLVGGEGNDYLRGQDGNDTYIGGSGNDSFIYEAMNGTKVIDDQGGGIDTLYLQDFAIEDFAIEEIAFYRDGDDLIILPENDVSQKIEVLKHFTDVNNTLEFILYGEDALQASVFDLTQNIEAYPGDDALGGSTPPDTGNPDGGTTPGAGSPGGWDGDDTVIGTTNDDLLVGGLGDDSLEGQAGNDFLMGGVGDDTYIIDGASNDVIVDTDGVNRVQFAQGIGINDVTSGLTRANDDLVITIASTGNQLRISDFFSVTNTIATFEFADGARIQAEQIYGANAPVNSVSSGELLFATDTQPNVLGTDLSEVIMGNDADNELNGAGGDDYLAGGEGNDIYQITANHGVDTIIDRDGSNTLLFSAETNVTASNFFEKLSVFSNLDELYIDTGSGQVIVEDFFSLANTVSTFTFADGSQLTSEEIITAYGRTPPSQEGDIVLPESRVTETSLASMDASLSLIKQTDLLIDALSSLSHNADNEEVAIIQPRESTFITASTSL
ncbi:MAG: calcium-binding protein [Pseudomonadota bacterium]